MRILLIVLLWAACDLACAGTPGTTLHVYGPGGPAPAMREAAAAFMAVQPDVQIELHVGPSAEWLPEAQNDADLVFSGAEYMLDALMQSLPLLVPDSAQALYLRPAAILVRPGNPLGIRQFTDLMREDIDLLVVNGAGQTALWEDLAGRRGQLDDVRAIRRNIAFRAGNSGQAKQAWLEHPEIDAWLIWSHWQLANPSLADLVTLSEPFRIFRDCGIALTRDGLHKPASSAFVAFLQSPEGEAIFSRHGWQKSFN
ncbi:MAG: substrate-binding domain-containing protein [Lysobacteraceae bacterium]